MMINMCPLRQLFESQPMERQHLRGQTSAPRPDRNGSSPSPLPRALSPPAGGRFVSVELAPVERGNGAERIEPSSYLQFAGSLIMLQNVFRVSRRRTATRVRSCERPRLRPSGSGPKISCNEPDRGLGRGFVVQICPRFVTMSKRPNLVIQVREAMVKLLLPPFSTPIRFAGRAVCRTTGGKENVFGLHGFSAMP
jgi:hypothetical protein